jgi:hypothetical protein
MMIDPIIFTCTRTYLPVRRGLQVTNLGAELMARAYNASTVAPQTRPVWGVAERVAPFGDSSALVEFEYLDVPDSPYADVPRTDNKDVHECPRRERAG